MLRSHKRLALPLQIALPALLPVLLILAGSVFFILPAIHDSFVETHRLHLRELTTTALGILNSAEHDVRNGRMTLEKAQQHAIDQLKVLRPDQSASAYFFVLGRDKTILRNPREPEQQKPFSDWKGTDRLRVIENILATADRDGGGYISYLAAKDPSLPQVAKMSYFTRFAPWDWVVGTGTFMDELDAQLARLRNRILLFCAIAGMLTLGVSGLVIWQAGRLQKVHDRFARQIVDNERKYRLLFEDSADATLILSQGRVANCNLSAVRLFGYTDKNDLLRLPVGEISAAIQPGGLPAEDAHENVMERARSGGLLFEWVYRTADGREFPAEVSLTPLAGGETVSCHAVLRDITGRKQAEREVMRTNFLLKNLIDNVPAVVRIKDMHGRYVMVNRSFEEQFGVSGDQIIGKTEGQVLPWEVAEMIRANDQNALKMPTGVRLTDAELIIGGQRRTFISMRFPLRTPEGGMSGICCVDTDITERKQLENRLRDLNENLEAKVASRTRELELANNALQASLNQLHATKEQLVESEKYAALGGLVAGIAHEINTPVGIGVTAVSHLRERLEHFRALYLKDELTRDDFEEMLTQGAEICTIIQTNLNRATELVSSFKRVAVDQSSEQKRTFNLKEYLDEVLLSLHPQYRKTSHKITVDCPPEIELNSYPGALSQIISNLLMNSLIHGFEHLPAGVITIQARVGGQTLHLVYRDNGAGIEAENLRQIFNPFFTTKRGHGGSGLGMHITYNLVTRTLGGTIRCVSAPGEGVCFLMDLPLSVNGVKAEAASEEDAQPSAHPGGNVATDDGKPENVACAQTEFLPEVAGSSSASSGQRIVDGTRIRGPWEGV